MNNIFDQNWYVKLSELNDSFQTGDVILVHGRYPFSVVIEAVQWSPWSHSAMVIRPEDVGMEKKYDGLLLWESNELTNIPDLITGKAKTGPMLVPFEERIVSTAKEFKGVKFACRHLYADRNPAMMAKLKEFMPTVINTTFPSTGEMGRMLLEGRISNKKADNNMFFCSMLVAATYMSMKLLGTGYPPNAYEPRDFSNAGTVPLLKRAFLGKEIFFKPQI
ncbi:hypothetical protein RCC89_12985 [Cytophagaceae bacterium ABcell3]|nr:hypothetical protein RCC89_12985 [Cytophagaceae bacterium ABcell3]